MVRRSSPSRHYVRPNGRQRLQQVGTTNAAACFRSHGFTTLDQCQAGPDERGLKMRFVRSSLVLSLTVVFFAVGAFAGPLWSSATTPGNNAQPDQNVQTIE